MRRLSFFAGLLLACCSGSSNDDLATTSSSIIGTWEREAAPATGQYDEFFDFREDKTGSRVVRVVGKDARTCSDFGWSFGDGVVTLERTVSNDGRKELESLKVNLADKDRLHVTDLKTPANGYRRSKLPDFCKP